MLAIPATLVSLRFAWPAAHNSYTTLIIEVAGSLVFASYWLIKGLGIRVALRQA